MSDKKPGRAAAFESGTRKICLAVAAVAVGLMMDGLPGVLLCLAGAMYLANTGVRMFRR